MFTVGVGAVVVWTGWGVEVISGVVDFWVVVGFAVVVVTTFSAVVELVNIVVVLDSDVTDASDEGRVDVITVVLFPWIRISEHA